MQMQMDACVSDHFFLHVLLHLCRCMRLELQGKLTTKFTISSTPSSHLTTVLKESWETNRDLATTAQPYILLSKQVPVPSSAHHEKRAGISSTGIAAALPMNAAGAASLLEGVRSYAFLPVSPSGLRFLVQVIVLWKLATVMCRAGQNHTLIGIHGVHTAILAGKSPYIRSYTVQIHGSGQP
jgi:hypothetical protein